MKNARKIAVFLLFASFLTTSVGCKKSAQYTSNFSARELAAAVQERIDEEDFVIAENGYLDDYVSLPDNAQDFVICLDADGNDIDEFGIWRLEEGSVGEIRALLESYLKTSLERNQAFYNSYIPHQIPKLRDAEIHVFGDYVAYAIMDGEDRKEFFGALENILLSKK